MAADGSSREGVVVKSTSVPLANQYRSVENLLRRPSPFGNETGSLPNGEFEAGPERLTELRESTKVLVIGAGGLGCEVSGILDCNPQHQNIFHRRTVFRPYPWQLLKDLALSGFCDIHVIDLDTIDLTNLNRQFLFRMKDIGHSKAEIAAKFVSERVPGVTVTWYRRPIQEFPVPFYTQFRVIIGGLDNLAARRWMNATLCSLIEVDEDGDITNPEALIPYIDGGTEGFKGQARVILPRITACFECTLDMFPPQVKFPECTLASTPRQPEHCIMYAKERLWRDAFGDKELDTDDPEQMKWIFEKAEARAAEFGIQGVTLAKTQGVVKNIIPAIASTNALVSAVCALEAFKIVTFCSQTLDSYLMALGDQGLHAQTFPLERKGPSECLACQTLASTVTVNPALTLQGLREHLIADPVLQLKSPSLGVPGQSLYLAKPPALERQLRPNLDKPIADLLKHGDMTIVTDPTFPRGVNLELTIKFDPTIPLPEP